MTFYEFSAELKTQLKQYFEAGLIDDASVLTWVNQALKKFGSNIMIYHEAVVEVEGGKGKLPENFYSLTHAVKCDKDYIECNPESEKILIKSFFWTDVQLKNKEWNICTGECRKNEVEEFTIREKTYIDGQAFNKYYRNPIELKLSRSFKKSLCDNECYNKYRSQSPYEINIIGNTLYTNFKRGDVYLKYRGLEVDEDGLVIIPDTPKGEVLNYVMTYVKRNIFESLLVNSEDTNIITLFRYYLENERPHLLLALTEVKFLGLNPDTFKKLRRKNSEKRLMFERTLRYGK